MAWNHAAEVRVRVCVHVCVRVCAHACVPLSHPSRHRLGSQVVKEADLPSNCVRSFLL